MPDPIERPTRAPAAGEPPILIEEYVGRVNSGEDRLSIAHLHSPPGWSEPGQRPEFDEFTLVLRGMLRVEHEQGAIEITAGQAVHARPGEWVRYSTPGSDGADYVAVCLPAFTLDTAHRDA